MPPARHTYSCHRQRERVTHPPRRHLPCNIVQCACCLTTTQSRSRTALNAARSAYLLVSPPEREGHPSPRRHLPCNIVQCACCLTTTQLRYRTALNAARSAYLLVSPPEREGHPPPSASFALQYRAMCMLSDYHAVTLPYSSECRSLGIPVLPPTMQQPAMCIPHRSSHAATPPSISILLQMPPARQTHAFD